MKAIKTLLILVLCAALVYFVGDKIGLWPEEVTETVDEAFAKVGSSLNSEPAGEETEDLGKPIQTEHAKSDWIPSSDPDKMIERHREFSEEEVLAAWKGMCDDQWRLSAEGNVDSIAELTNLSYEDAEGWVQFLKDASYNNYDSEHSYIIASADGYYFMETTYYLVTGTDPNTHQDSVNLNGTITWEDGKWKISSLAPLSLQDNLYSFYDPGLKEAIGAGRNISFFGNFMYLDPARVYQGCLASETVAAWQNEDGSLDIMFAGYNGTSTIKEYYSVTITLTDDNLGTICEVTRHEFDSIAPGRSKTFLVHVDPSEVMTGTNTWTSIYTNIDTYY